jgi:uncharacterized protein (DUF1499 family)
VIEKMAPNLPFSFRFGGKLNIIAFWAGIFLAVCVAIAIIITRYELIDKMAGFNALMFLNIAAILVTGIALVSLILGLWNKFKTRKSYAIKPALIGLLLAGGYAVATAVVMSPVAYFPLLHDISTNLVDPPQFQKIVLRKDNLAGIDTVAAWQDAHRNGYPDMKPLVLKQSVEVVYTNAKNLMEQRNWRLVVADSASLQLEATDTVSILRFHDDIVLRVRPATKGGGSIVDMRSVSRVGVSDLGVNAKRIRAFLKDLAASN